MENKGKLEPIETPRCLIPHLLVVFTQQLEILTTTLHISCSLNLLGVDNKDVSAALQMLLTELKLRLQHRLFLV